MQAKVKKALAAAVFFSAMTAAGAASANITDNRFEKKTQEELERLQIADSDVKSIQISLFRRKNDRGPEIRGAESWVRLHSCSGHLVIFMNRAAFVRDVYTRGDCSIPGLANY